MNEWTSDLGDVRTPQQARSRKTQDRLLDAAEQRLATHGVDGTSITDVAADAGSSVGSLYHHFGDKSGLQTAVFNRFAAGAEAVTALAVDPSRWDGAGVVDILHGYVDAVLQADSDNPSAKRAALEVARVDSAASDRLDKLSSSLDAGVRDLLLARRSEIGHPNPSQAIDYVTHWIGAGLRARVEYPADHERHGPPDVEVYLAETMRAVCAYLQVSA